MKTTPPSPDAPHRGATAAQIKDDINSGLTGDKVAGFDPAAAPLGTDEEAGGAPYDPQLLAKTREQEMLSRPQNAKPNASTPDLQPDASRSTPSHLTIALITAFATAIAATVLYLIF